MKNCLHFLFALLITFQSNVLLAQEAPSQTNHIETSMLSDADQIDITKKCTMPEYVDELRGYGLTGDVVLKTIIDEEGKLGSFEVIRSSGWKVLDYLTMKAISNCQFLPEGKYTVSQHKTITFKWQLEGYKPPTLDESSCKQSHLVRIATDEDKERGIVVGAVVSPMGNTETSSIQWSSGNAEIDQESLRVVNSCSFKRSVLDIGNKARKMASVRLVKK